MLGQIGHRQLAARRNLLVIAMTALGVLAVIYFYQYRAIADLQRERLILQSQIALTKDFLKLHPNIASDEQAGEARLAKVDRYLPDDLAADQFIEQLAAAAAASDVKLEAVEIGQVLQATDLSSVTVQLKLAGSYLGLLEFLRKLERVERFFSVDTCEISTAPVALNCNISIKIYACSPINISEKQEYVK